MKFFRNITITLVAFGSFVSLSYAALTGDVLISPESPGPYDSVSLTLQSYSFDVDTSIISWSINGKAILVGQGEKVLKVQLGGAGALSQVKVAAQTKDGSTFESRFTLSPQSVDILWETKESFVPPFYKGKALPGEGALISFLAVPSFSTNGKPTPASNLAYMWYINDNYVVAGSGKGKNALAARLDYLSDENRINVVVKNDDGLTASQTITLQAHTIVPSFYVKDDVLGVQYENLLGRRFETTKEFTVKFVPYFISSKGTVASGIESNWTLGGLPVTQTGDNEITFRPQENSYGAKLLGVSIKNAKRILQQAASEVEIVFDTRK